MMGLQRKTASTTPARSDFARRLRELRVPRGFRTARSLARALDIDENRYTRYERAEVEPDLDMIRRICETLEVTPNELLGVSARLSGSRANDASPPRPRTSNRAATAPAADGDDGIGLHTAAWLLAEAVIALRAKDREAAGQTDGEAPLAAVRETGTLYRELMDHPFEAIMGLLADQVITGADAADAVPVRERIDGLVALLKSR